MAPTISGNKQHTEMIVKELCGDRGLFAELIYVDGKKSELLYVSVLDGVLVSGLGQEERKPVLFKKGVSVRILSSSVTTEKAKDLYQIGKFPDFSEWVLR